MCPIPLYIFLNLYSGDSTPIIRKNISSNTRKKLNNNILNLKNFKNFTSYERSKSRFQNIQIPYRKKIVVSSTSALFLLICTHRHWPQPDDSSRSSWACWHRSVRQLDEDLQACNKVACGNEVYHRCTLRKRDYRYQSDVVQVHRSKNRAHRPSSHCYVRWEDGGCSHRCACVLVQYPRRSHCSSENNRVSQWTCDIPQIFLRS